MFVGERVSQPGRVRRPHVRELDLLRVVTAFGVVAVHTLAGAIIFAQTPPGVALQRAAEGTMHFTREVFMFTTALVLVYTYVDKRFDLGVFWRKRGIGVVVPYAIWSAIYLMLPPQSVPPDRFAATWLRDLWTGDAAVQLYYILLTIQFYLLFPLILWLLPLFDRYPWRTLFISGALELLMLGTYFFVVLQPPVANTAAGAWMIKYLARLAPVYQFYFVLGAVCALRLDRLRTFALRHGRLIALGFGAGLLLYGGNYVYWVGVARDDPVSAIEVLQPVMLFYSLGVIAFMWWVACRWAGSAGDSQPPAGARLWRLLADASFGVYLLHPLFINFALGHSALMAPAFLPQPARVIAVWLFAVVGSSLASVLLMRTPVLSRLVGRATPLPTAVTSSFTSVRQRLAGLMGGAHTGNAHTGNAQMDAEVAGAGGRDEERALEPARAERRV
jgi:peptidoglycan/LPS O-acetylase OafA/YrhL